MLTFIKNLFGGSSSKNVAKSRLQFVLVQDRTGLTNEELAGFKKELVEVIERYFMIDKSGFDVSYKREGETTTLFINSPIIVKRQDTPGGEVGAKKKKLVKKVADKEESKDGLETLEQDVGNS